MSFIILSDTSCNLPQSLLAPEEICLVPFTYYPRENSAQQLSCTDIEHFDSKTYYDEIREGKLYNTSQIAPQTYFDLIEPYAKAGKDVLYVGMSSGISGSYHSSQIAKQMLEEAYPERKFLMFDTMGASLGEGLAVLYAAEWRRQGKSIDECYAALEALRPRICQVFTVDSLKHLQRTGRLSNAARILGTVLNIKPILKGNELGQIVTAEKVRGSARALKALAERYDAEVREPEKQIVGIAHADNPEGAAQLAALLRENNPPKEILTVCYEPVTGAHVGPGTVALFFLGDSDVRSH